ncbi:MAG: transaldolase family protein [Christensenellales bacterium]
MDIKEMKCTIGALVATNRLQVMDSTEKGMFDRIKELELTYGAAGEIDGSIQYIGVSDEFKKVIRTFKTEEGVIPAGFRPEFVLGYDNSIRVNLKRDISYQANGVKRPTNVLYSANSANPFEVETMKDMIANLTTNPQIIYSQFINNPKANIGGKFKDRYEVMRELCRIVGPGVDISVEVNNPFAPENELLEEISRFEEILTPYRLVVKVPHTGPLTKDNVGNFLAGKDYNIPYDVATAAEFFAGHNMALRFKEKGYRVNFTLMFEPSQTALALLAKPYFINAFVETRYVNTLKMKELLAKLDTTGDISFADQLREFMISTDMLAANDVNSKAAVAKARDIVAYRAVDTKEGFDGLDSVRHSLRVLRQSNLPDTRLIICNTKSQKIYWDIDKMLMEPEFADMTQRVVITCNPDYFGIFTSSPGIYSYQRAFLKSVTD